MIQTQLLGKTNIYGGIRSFQDLTDCSHTALTSSEGPIVIIVMYCNSTRLVPSLQVPLVKNSCERPFQ